MPGTPLRGIDGVIRCGGTYYGIFNGSPPGKLVAITLSDSALTYTKPLGDDGLSDPTQIAFDGKRLLMVEDSGWETLEKSPSARASGARIVAVPLGDDCKPD